MQTAVTIARRIGIVGIAADIDYAQLEGRLSSLWLDHLGGQLCKCNGFGIACRNSEALLADCPAALRLANIYQRQRDCDIVSERQVPDRHRRGGGTASCGTADEQGLKGRDCICPP